ncbi:hypothetical protein V474_20755 [Novosphingobium barchaimii LL02]|uniref:Uncharacterized protein n=2 Tax=Novosphingobium barchaimii TaxID=1420591 RepID=A0A0J8ALR2_9SPHN|nr:hypothetical protein V474_20755 [Novosphingobium barchaimii LL02]
MGLQRHYAVTALALAAFVCPLHAEEEGHGDIVVESARDPQSFDSGEWLITVSRSYRFGKSLDGDDSLRATGSDRDWRFCLPDVRVEAFVRLLVGEGRSQAAGTTVCRPLQVSLRDGRVRAGQTCAGGSVTSMDEVTHLTTTHSTRLLVAVTGRYAPAELKLDFENQRELLIADPTQAVRPDIMRWSVSGRRVGDCGPAGGPRPVE